ncbi:MAG: NAD-dependent epimerase/dehydratase family protein [Reyranellaceae bacterium]
MRYLVTGTAGFIGFHVARRLLRDGHTVVGLDGLTPYYDRGLKAARNERLEALADGRFRLHRCLLEDLPAVEAAFRDAAPERVIHLAAQAGVRYSLENPRAYVDSNIVGSFNLLEACHRHGPQHVLLASTSSVYGDSSEFPLVESARTDYPLTLYAASKKSMEAMAHGYAHLWGLPTTVFRLFTVYGPWGRPDMALFKFVDNIVAGVPIDVYNYGRMERDLTYVDDVVEAIVGLCDVPPSLAASGAGDAGAGTSGVAPYRIVNIGGRQPVGLLDLIDEIEKALGRTAERNYMAMQPGDVPRTEASTELIETLIGFRPTTPMADGVRAFVAWYREHYRL